MEIEMADFVITENTTKHIPSLVKVITLTAGDRIGDDAQLADIAARTVPVGYEVDVRIRIMVKDIREV
jgi:hypothetical protein